MKEVIWGAIRVLVLDPGIEFTAMFVKKSFSGTLTYTLLVFMIYPIIFLKKL